MLITTNAQPKLFCVSTIARSFMLTFVLFCLPLQEGNPIPIVENIYTKTNLMQVGNFPYFEFQLRQIMQIEAVSEIIYPACNAFHVYKFDFKHSNPHACTKEHYTDTTYSADHLHRRAYIILSHTLRGGALTNWFKLPSL